MAVDFTTISAYQAPEESPGFLLWRVSTLWRRAIEAVLKPLGLTHPQFVILATIGWLTRNGEKATQIAISRQAGLDPNTTSQVLRGLQAKKLIERSEEGRDKYPLLTQSGMTSLQKALPTVEQADKKFFAQINSMTLTKHLQELNFSLR